MIDTRLTLSRAGDEIMDAARKAEGIATVLSMLSTALDGPRPINGPQVARALELLVGCCGSVQHRLDLAHELIETVAAEVKEGQDE